jgi:hypothetical protein
MQAHDALGSIAQVGGVAALREGATVPEIVEVLKLVSTLGTQSVNVWIALTAAGGGQSQPRRKAGRVLVTTESHRPRKLDRRLHTE